jgi:hypothetical protein
MEQWPAWQETPALELTWDSWVQSWPQLPQLWTSVCRLVHWPLQVSGLAPLQAH